MACQPAVPSNFGDFGAALNGVYVLELANGRDSISDESWEASKKWQ